jgi:hypothetical protein
MIRHCILFIAAGLLLPSMALGKAQSPPAQPPSAVERMSAPGPEAKALADRSGLWDVVFSVWPAPGAPPAVTRGILAERTMIGPFLQEVMRAAPGSATPDFRRIDYLSFDRVEGRYKYVSLDTRFPAGIMPAWSFGGERDGKITLQFEAIGFVGFGQEVEGRFTLSDMVITRPGPDQELKQQHFIQANGTGTAWLAVQYEYRRRQ